MLSCIYQFSSLQSLSRVWLFETPWTTACQTSLSVTNYQSLLKLMSIELVMPSNHLILCCLLLLPSIFPSIRVFSNESPLHITWPKYWSFSFNISPSSEYSGFPWGLTGLISLQSSKCSINNVCILTSLRIYCICFCIVVFTLNFLCISLHSS